MSSTSILDQVKSYLNEEPKFFVVVVGNPLAGLYIYGPFQGYDTAHRQASERLSNHNWWIAELLDTSSWGPPNE